MTHRVQNCYQTRHFVTSASSVGTSAVSQTAHLQSAAVYLPQVQNYVCQSDEGI